MSSKTSSVQFDVLVKFMERHGDLQSPKQISTPHGRLKNLGLWEELTEHLNILGPPVRRRSSDKWKKVWSDYKNNTKKKAVRLSRGISSHGNTVRAKLTDLENRVLKLMQQDCLITQSCNGEKDNIVILELKQEATSPEAAVPDDATEIHPESEVDPIREGSDHRDPFEEVVLKSNETPATTDYNTEDGNAGEEFNIIRGLLTNNSCETNKSVQKQQTNSKTNDSKSSDEWDSDPLSDAEKKQAEDIKIHKTKRKNQTNANEDPLQSKIIKFMHTYARRENNRHMSFFNGILPTLEGFNDNEVIEFQMGVLNLLKNIKSNRQSNLRFVLTPVNLKL